jgi:HAD superfamily hydrolase (TIGR01509 family)
MKFARGDIAGISFDYGHVLAGLDLDELRARLGAMTEAFALPPPRGTRDALVAAMPRAYAAHDEAIARGLQHEGGWRALIATLVRAAMDDAVLDEATDSRFVDALWAAQPTRNLWRAVPLEARRLLDALSRAQVPMVITSNSEGHVAELIAEVGIAHHFAAILDSGVLGFGKPDRRMFDAAVTALGVDRARVVHVGDSEAADVVGAQNAGLRTVRFDGFVPGAAGRPSRADAVVLTHAALESLLLDGIA